MEQAKIRRVLAKILLVLVVVVVVGLVVGGGWALLYSNWLANNEDILLLRNRYFYQLSQRFPPGTLLYSVRPTSVERIGEEAIFTYKLMGRVESADYKEQILTVQDMWGREWWAHFPTEPDKTIGNLAKTVLNQNTYWADGKVTNKIVYIDIDTSAPGATKGLRPGDIVILSWRDSRRAGEISGVIELRDDKILPITLINWWKGENASEI